MTFVDAHREVRRPKQNSAATAKLFIVTTKIQAEPEARKDTSKSKKEFHSGKMRPNTRSPSY